MLRIACCGADATRNTQHARLHPAVGDWFDHLWVACYTPITLIHRICVWQSPQLRRYFAGFLKQWRTVVRTPGHSLDVHMRRLTSPIAILVVLAFVIELLAACATPVPPSPAVDEVATPTATLRPARTPTRQPPAAGVATVAPGLGTCAPASDADFLAVGLLAPLSQAQAWPRALALQAGASIALEELNSAGGVLGRPLRLISLDTQGDAALAASLAEQLITQECIIGLLGGIGGETAAIAEVTERYGVPFLVAETPDDSLTASQPAALFRIGPTTTQMEEFLPGWLAAVGDYNGDGSVLAVLVAENSASGDMMVEQMERQAPGHGITLEPLRVDLPMEDFSPVIARIVAMEQAPDVVLIHMTGDPGLVLIQQLLDAGIGPAKGTLLLAGRAALDSTRFWQLAPSGERTAVIRRGPWYTSLTDAGRAFYEKYRLLSNQWPEWPAIAGYDSLYLLAVAATQAETVQPAALLAALEVTDITLAGGRYRFPYGSANPPDGVTAPASWWHQWLDPQMLILQYRTAQQDASTLDVVWPPLYSTGDSPALR